ncbi:hypothetical protein ACOME3_001674 [Neoechinorhynchus agilis]
MEPGRWSKRRTFLALILTLIIIVTLAATLLISTYLYALHGGEHENLGIVFDAGSSSTKLYVYKWNGEWSDGEKTIRSIEEIASGKSRKPLAHLKSDNLSHAVREHFRPMMDELARVIPEDKRKSITVSLGATAGMRSLSQTNPELCKQILNAVRSFIVKEGYYTDERKIRILDGSEEGMYAWYTAQSRWISASTTAAINVLLAKMNPKTQELYTDGVLDMGGGSMQIAFVPKNETALRVHKINFTTSPFFQHRLKLYVQSFDCQGADYSYLSYLRYIIDNSPKNQEISDPCGLNGHKHELNSSKISSNPCSNYRWNPRRNLVYSIIGTGNPEKCKSTVDRAMKLSVCTEAGCNFSGALVPRIEETDTFKLIGSFYYTWKALDEPIGQVAFDKVLETKCKERVSNPDKFRVKLCYDGYNVRTLMNRLNISMNYFGSRSMQPIDKLDSNKSRGWALGYMLSINNAIPRTYPIWSRKSYYLSRVNLILMIGLTFALTITAILIVFPLLKK